MANSNGVGITRLVSTVVVLAGIFAFLVVAMPHQDGQISAARTIVTGTALAASFVAVTLGLIRVGKLLADSYPSLVALIEATVIEVTLASCFGLLIAANSLGMFQAHGCAYLALALGAILTPIASAFVAFRGKRNGWLLSRTAAVVTA